MWIWEIHYHLLISCWVQSRNSVTRTAPAWTLLWSPGFGGVGELLCSSGCPHRAVCYTWIWIETRQWCLLCLATSCPSPLLLQSPLLSGTMRICWCSVVSLLTQSVEPPGPQPRVEWAYKHRRAGHWREGSWRVCVRVRRRVCVCV